MNDNPRKLWAEALREPGRKQTKGVLNSEHGQCCLGVLCDVYRAATGEGAWSKKTTRDDYGPTAHQTTVVEHTAVRMFMDERGLNNTYLPPRTVREWFGLRDDEVTAFAELNDKRGFTFDEIAKVLDDGVDVRALADRLQLEHGG